jgi:hypothetical protein
MYLSFYKSPNPVAMMEREKKRYLFAHAHGCALAVAVTG